jgi:hypothetical protein
VTKRLEPEEKARRKHLRDERTRQAAEVRKALTKLAKTLSARVKRGACLNFSVSRGHDEVVNLDGVGWKHYVHNGDDTFTFHIVGGMPKSKTGGQERANSVKPQQPVED